MPNRTHWRAAWLARFHERLAAAYGPQHWWPADSPAEVVIGAILTQNTSWKNVERAIAAMKQAGLFDWRRLRDLDESSLAEIIRPAGTYRVKARRLKAFVAALWTTAGGSLERMLGGPLEDARRRLLAISGIGPETADAILLYAADRPTFVVDAYTRRILRRHFWRPGERPRSAAREYEALRAAFHAALPHSARLFNEFHALLVTVGKRHCRTRAVCKGCPLEAFPHDPDL